MWPLVLAVGVGAVLGEIFSSNQSTGKKKIFVSFAIEDQKYRDFLVAQAKNENSPFDFFDMSVKQPWNENEWKRKCREKIRKCDGLIVLLSKNSLYSTGARWEIKCAKEEGIPVVGMHINKNKRGPIPPELRGRQVIIWSWDNLEEIIDSF